MEILNDLKYIQKILKEKFQLISFIKLSAIPLCLGVLSYLFEKYSGIQLPQHFASAVTFITTIITTIIVVCFVVVRKCRQFEEPKIELLYENSDIYVQLEPTHNFEKIISYKVGINNTSYTPIKNLKVTLVSIKDETSELIIYKNKVLKHYNSSVSAPEKFSIAPNDTEYFYLALHRSFKSADEMDGKQLLDMLSQDHNIYFRVLDEYFHQGEWLLAIKISSDNFLPVDYRFSLKLTEEGTFSCERIN